MSTLTVPTAPMCLSNLFSEHRGCELSPGVTHQHVTRAAVAMGATILKDSISVSLNTAAWVCIKSWLCAQFPFLTIHPQTIRSRQDLLQPTVIQTNIEKGRKKEIISATNLENWNTSNTNFSSFIPFGFSGFTRFPSSST